MILPHLNQYFKGIAYNYIFGQFYASKRHSIGYMGGADLYAMYAEAYTSKNVCMLSCALAYTKYQR